MPASRDAMYEVAMFAGEEREQSDSRVLSLLLRVVGDARRALQDREHVHVTPFRK